jgi:hypothetical protein
MPLGISFPFLLMPDRSAPARTWLEYERAELAGTLGQKHEITVRHFAAPIFLPDSSHRSLNI